MPTIPLSLTKVTQQVLAHLKKGQRSRFIEEALRANKKFRALATAHDIDISKPLPKPGPKPKPTND